MSLEPLRVALFSGNYNYVRDGANQALNRLVGYLLRQGAEVRVYSPVVEKPAFPATGPLMNLPSFSIPTRSEYRVPMAMGDAVKRDLAHFQPNLIHVASPDIASHRALSWARKRRIPAVASVHTRFETYLQYYHLQLVEPLVRSILRRFYRRCDAIMVPAPSTAAILRAQRMSTDINIWGRGIDRDQFNPERRSLEWRRSHGIGDGEMAVAFLGRIVMEKGLDVFSAVIKRARSRGVPLRVLVIGDGPARPWFTEHLPGDAVFVGMQTGTDLAVALASADVFFNPSITETFGNVTLEAMASGVPVLSASASGSNSIVRDGVSGTVVDPFDLDSYADALDAYAADPDLRRRHGQAGLDHARTQDWDDINGEVMQLYRRVIARRERTRRG